MGLGLFNVVLPPKNPRPLWVSGQALILHLTSQLLHLKLQWHSAFALLLQWVMSEVGANNSYINWLVVQ